MVIAAFRESQQRGALGLYGQSFLETTSVPSAGGRTTA